MDFLTFKIELVGNILNSGAVDLKDSKTPEDIVDKPVKIFTKPGIGNLGYFSAGDTIYTPPTIPPNSKSIPHLPFSTWLGKRCTVSTLEESSLTCKDGRREYTLPWSITKESLWGSASL
jgi:hypothetical protein